MEHWGAGLAVVGSASNLGSSLPHDLREVSPSGEVGHIWVGLAVLGGLEEVKLAVVPHVGDDTPDKDRWILGRLGGCRGTGHGNVLAVTTTAWGPVRG